MLWIVNSTARTMKTDITDFRIHGMNAATPYEQSEAVRLFIAHTPNVRNLVWSLDRSWCDRPEQRRYRVKRQQHPQEPRRP